MKRIHIVGLCLMAAFAFSAGAASSASADLKAQLKGGGSIVGTTFLSKGGLARLATHSGKEIHCTSVTDHGVFLSGTLGHTLIRFLGCTAKEGIFTVKCNTTGGGTGEIHLALSTLFHLGLARLGTNTTIPALAILPGKTIEMKCSFVTIKVVGNVIGALQKANEEPIALKEPRKEINLNFQQTANGLQHLRQILMPGSTAPTEYDLESSFAGGAFELASEVASATLDGFTSGGAAAEIELVEP